jgi:hypothetical protein
MKEKREKKKKELNIAISEAYIIVGNIFWAANNIRNREFVKFLQKIRLRILNYAAMQDQGKFDSVIMVRRGHRLEI